MGRRSPPIAKRDAAYLRAAAVSQATKPEWRDPLPAIVDYARRLKEAHIEMILVPVPPKALVYPDNLGDRLTSSIYTLGDYGESTLFLSFHYYAATEGGFDGVNLKAVLGVDEELLVLEEGLDPRVEPREERLVVGSVVLAPPDLVGGGVLTDNVLLLGGSRRPLSRVDHKGSSVGDGSLVSEHRLLV